MTICAPNRPCHACNAVAADPVHIGLARLNAAPLNTIAAAAAAGDHTGYDEAASAAARHREMLAARLDHPAALGSAALWYAAQGLAVFPLKPQTKEPLPGSRGVYDATVDRDRIRSWWQQIPDANIGLAAGSPYDVIDVDGAHGYESYLELAESLLAPAVVGMARTPGDPHRYREPGLHLYIAAEPGAKNGSNLAPGIDYRAAGGYTVAPPSAGPIADAGRYEWITPIGAAA